MLQMSFFYLFIIVYIYFNPYKAFVSDSMSGGNQSIVINGLLGYQGLTF